MKKVLALTLASSMILSSLAMSASASDVTTVSASKFSDSESHWAVSSIDRWSDLNIVNGFDGLFRPNANITRGEVAVILDRIMGYELMAGNSFSDLDSNFYTDSLLKANKAGIILGSGDAIRPTADITREEVAVMICRALHLDTADYTTTDFADHSEISSWALGAVARLSDDGIVNGKADNKFDPKANITRGEIVAILDRAVATFVNSSDEYSQDVDGNVVINSKMATLSDMHIKGDLILAEGIEDGDVYLNNVVVDGNITVKGGGEHSVYFENVNVGGILDVAKLGSIVRVVISGESEIASILINSDVKVEVEGDAIIGEIIVAIDVELDLSGNIADIIITETTDETETETDEEETETEVEEDTTTSTGSTSSGSLGGGSSSGGSSSGGTTTTPDPEDDVEDETDEETETSPEVTPEPETTPEVSPEVTPEPETTPEVSPEVTPEPETTPEVSPEVTPEPETTPEVSPEVTPDPETTPEVSPEVTPDPETTPEVDDTLQTYEGCLTKSGYDVAKGVYTYNVSGETFTSSEDLSGFFGMNVTVTHEETSSEIVSMEPYNSEVLFYGIGTDIGDYDSTEVVLNGTTYPLDSNAGVYYMNNIDTGVNLSSIAPNPWVQISAIDNDTDGDIDMIVVLPYEVVEVTYVGTVHITLTGGTIGVISVADDAYPTDIVAGDVVRLIKPDYTAKGNYVLDKLDLIQGMVASRSGMAGSYKYRINDVWYTSIFELTLGREYICYVVGTHIVVAEEHVEYDEIVYLKNAIVNNSIMGSTTEALIYFLDGTYEVIVLAAVYDVDGETELEISNNSVDDFEDQGLYTYKVSSGEYTLTAMGTGNDAGFDHIETGAYIEDGKLSGGSYVADDAIVIVVDEDYTYDKGEEVKGDGLNFLTGSDVNVWSNAYGTSYLALANTVNGLVTAEVLYIVGVGGIPGVAGVETYGYVTSDVCYELDANRNGIYTFTVWTDEGEKSVYTDDAYMANVAVLGSTIGFELKEDGEVTDVVAVGDRMAVTGYSSSLLCIDVVGADGSLSGATSDYALTSYTTYIYVNTSTYSGVEGGSLRTATQYDEGKYYSNIVLVSDEDGEVVVVFVDVNNKYDF